MPADLAKLLSAICATSTAWTLCGKSTHCRCSPSSPRRAGLPVRRLREPGGTAIGDQIRRLLLSPEHDMDVHCEMLLYMASRAQLVHQQIKPALAAGECVLSDRFASSTLGRPGRRRRHGPPANP